MELPPSTWIELGRHLLIPVSPAQVLRLFVALLTGAVCRGIVPVRGAVFDVSPHLVLCALPFPPICSQRHLSGPSVSDLQHVFCLFIMLEGGCLVLWKRSSAVHTFVPS